jgi:hypothetical protein
LVLWEEWTLKQVQGDDDGEGRFWSFSVTSGAYGGILANLPIATHRRAAIYAYRADAFKFVLVIPCSASLAPTVLGKLRPLFFRISHREILTVRLTI